MKRYPITFEGETTDVGTTGELLAALDVLQGQHDRMALEQLKEQLPVLITNAHELEATLKFLSADDRQFLIESLGASLTGIMGSALGLRNIFALLAENRVEMAVMNTLGTEGLRTLIGDAEELAEALQFVYDECNRTMIEMLGADYLRGLFQSGYDVSLVFNAVDNDTQLALVEMISWELLVSLVRDQRDLGYIMRALPDETSARLMKHYTKESLWKIVRNERGWKNLRRFLSAEETRVLGDLLEVSHAS